MNTSQWAVVIPSNRAVSSASLAALPPDLPVYVVEDGPVPIAVDHPGARIFTQDFQRRFMGRDFDLIPRGTAACRNFAFCYLWRETDVSFIVSLDDDVATRPGFIEAYQVLGTSGRLDTITGSDWLNTISLFEDPPECYARGYPYEARGETTTRLTDTTARVVCHMGLWDRVLDTHALDKHLFGAYREEYPNLRLSRSIVRSGCDSHPMYFPFSSMNFGFVRELLPAMYQMPMRPRFADRYALWRYDDIWTGYIAQSLATKRGDAFTAGAPIVDHQKAGDLHREMLGEHYGMLISPYLYGAVDRAMSDVKTASYSRMYLDLIDRMLTLDQRVWSELRVPELYRRFILELMRGLERWAALCAEAAST